MPIRNFKNHQPQIDPTAYIDDLAVIIGDVSIGADCSIWPLVAIRGDMHKVSIGARSNVQDGSVLHETHAGAFTSENGFALMIGSDVTIGHKAILHGCTIGNRVLIGMGAIVLDGAILEDDLILGAGSLVPPNKKLKSGFLYMGSPVKQIRPLSARDYEFLIYSAHNYVKLKNEYYSK